MPGLKSDRQCGYYVCGRCKGNIRFLKLDGRPDICPQCGYGHGLRDVNDVPSEVRLNLGSLANDGDGSRGASEDTTITSR